MDSLQQFTPWLAVLVVVATNVGIVIWHISRLNTEMKFVKSELLAIREDRSQIVEIGERVSHIEGFLAGQGFKSGEILEFHRTGD